MSNEEINTEMNGKSIDIAEQRKRELAQLFPGSFTETVNDNGEVVTSVDFNKLKAELGEFTDIYENHRERYGMEWPGKKEALKLIQEPSRATLKPCREESVDFDNTENIFIEGDNLEVLKLLQKSYYGKVKMIYIDPPYNTGKEFIYPDKYSENLETYLAYAGLVNDEGKKFTTNTAAEGRFHTKWLNMMYPRLYLARNLLRDDGVIFISIDDNEIENVRRLCDEIFGEENFLSQIIWHKKYAASNDTKGIAMMHDYIVAYKKSEKFERKLLPRTEKQNGLYKYDDNDGKGLWRPDNLSVKTVSESYLYSIKNPITSEEYYPPKGRCWLTNEDKIKTWIDEGRVFFGRKGDGAPQLKRYLSEVQQGIVPQSYWSYDDVGHTDAARKQLKQVFDGEAPFDNPKPVGLIKRIIQISVDSEDIIMDFFAGSATTAHACLEFNSENNKNIKFIQVQLPEQCDEKSDAFLAGYKTIADIGKARISRVADKIRIENESQLDLEGNTNTDLGFKVLKLDQSNFKKWHASLESTVTLLEHQLELHVEHISDSVSQEDILFELLLKSGFMPTEKVKLLELEDGKVYSIAEDALLICLEDEITAELINAIVEIEPLQFICLDKAFHGNDQLKANTVQTFASLNQGRDKSERIEFRTV